MSDLAGYLRLFITEAEESLVSLNNCLLELERDPTKVDVLNEMFRSAHTLKGAAASMGFEEIAKLSHEMENLLDQLRSGKLQSSQRIIDILFSSLDGLQALVGGVSSEEEKTIDISEVLGELQTVLLQAPDAEEKPERDGKPVLLEVTQKPEFTDLERKALIEAGEQGLNVFRITVSLEEDCVLKSVRAFMVFRDLENTGRIVKAIPDVQKIEDEEFGQSFTVILATKADEDEFRDIVESSSEVERVDISRMSMEELGPERPTSAVAKLPEPEEPEKGKPASITAPLVSAGQTVRVPLERLDNLGNLVGELVINKSRLVQIAAAHEITDLKECIAHLDRLTSDLQNEIMQSRLVPVSQIFNRFPRMVRDLAKNSNKEIDLIMEGTEIEVDRAVLAQIGEPLMHLLRNAVDHGIEPPEERKRLGKPPAGSVKLVAGREKEHVLMVVSDDGKGIDPEKIRDAAIRKGLIDAEQAEKLEDKEAIMLVFLPGFSTAEEVSEVSGRGVGMDVVTSTIESLNGSVILDSKVGAGTKCTLKLPLTMAILRALLVKLQQQTYLIPFSNVQEILSVDKSKIQYLGSQEAISLRESVLPIVRLGEIFGHPIAEDDGQGELSVVVIEVGDDRVGLVVDAVVGQEEIVVKSLEGLSKGVKGYAGVTILGDGRGSFILDVSSLVD